MNEEDTKDYFDRRPHWSNINPLPPYAIFPSTIDPWVPTFWHNFPQEKKVIYAAFKKPRTNVIVPKSKYSEVLKCGWPPKIISTDDFPPETLQDVETLSFEEIEKKYGYKAYGLFTPFVKKRVKSRRPLSFECDHRKQMTTEEILAQMKYFTYRNLKGNPRTTKVPIMHSDGIHYVLGSWQYYR